MLVSRTCCRLTHPPLWSVRANSYVLNEFVVTGVNGTAKLVTSEEELRTTSTRECYQCATRSGELKDCERAATARMERVGC